MVYKYEQSIHENNGRCVRGVVIANLEAGEQAKTTGIRSGKRDGEGTSSAHVFLGRGYPH